LLSALTGAFVIETGKQLSEDPAVLSTFLLSQIVVQLNASIVLPSASLHQFAGPSPNTRAVNSLLYVSLALSLANVTLGLLCLQWIRELKSDPPGILDADYPSIRCVRYHGLEKWGAKGIVNSLPVLLLASLVCFFAGLLFHVFAEDWVVAVPASVVLSATFAILVLTTILPAIVVIRYTAFHPGGGVGAYGTMPPFRSLQSWLVLQLGIWFVQSTLLKSARAFRSSLRDLQQCPDWARIDFLWTQFTKTSISQEKLLLPLILSAGDNVGMEVILNCYQDDFGPIATASLTNQRLDAFRHFASSYAGRLPPNTLEHVSNGLIDNLVRLVNDGVEFADLADLSVELSLDLCLVRSRGKAYRLPFFQR